MESSGRKAFTMNLAGVNAEWAPRHSHCSVYVQGNILVLGGFCDEQYSLNDVWVSSDGKVPIIPFGVDV
jgi:hypothetical protein